MPVWGRDDRRGQGNVIGLVLLLAVTIAGATTVVAFGGDAIAGLTESATTGAAEQSMTQFDSEASLVAHGESDAQRVRLAGADSAIRSVDADAGWLNVSIHNETTGEVDAVLTNTTLGAVVYRDGDTSVAYQGGGVWRRTGNGSTMVSPPEFHYRGTTLTLPLVRVAGDPRLDGEVVVSRDGPSTPVYPDADAGFANPLDDGTVVITVHSAYYEAWGRFFEQRTAGNVSLDRAAETATIELVVPFDADFDNVVASTSPGGVSANPGPPPEPYRSGVAQPSADALIESKIEECRSDSDACDAIDGSSIAGPTTYFVDHDLSGDLDIDTSSGNVSVVVDGEFEPETVTVTGNNSTTFYVRRDFTVDGGDELNVGGSADDLRVLVHSDGDVTFNGNYKFVGFVYAPGSEVDLNGGGGPNTVNLEGGVIGDTITVNGEPNEFEYDPSLRTVTLDVTGTAAPRITYLHVSITEVDVEDD